jgi:hypothetical protein
MREPPERAHAEGRSVLPVVWGYFAQKAAMSSKIVLNVGRPICLRPTVQVLTWLPFLHRINEATEQRSRDNVNSLDASGLEVVLTKGRQESYRYSEIRAGNEVSQGNDDGQIRYCTIKNGVLKSA